MIGQLDQFFGASESQPGLELFRVAFGLTTALYFAKRLSTVDLCFGRGGIADNLWQLRERRLRLSPFVWAPHSRWTGRVMLTTGLLAALGVALGYRTTVCATLLFSVQVMLNAEAWFVTTGVDFIVATMSGLLALSEAGAAWSLDNPVALVPETPVLPTRLMQLQVCLIYLFGVGQKLSERQWRSGWAVYYALEALGVSRARSRWLTARPWLTRCLAWATITIQLIAPFALWWEPVRGPCLVAAIGLHVGLDLFLRLWPFQWLMLSSLLLFVSPGDPTW